MSAGMLKVAGIRDEGPGRRVFEVREEDDPAPVDCLTRVVGYAAQLLLENAVPGTFRVAADGLIALDLPAEDQTYFHDGILFAALDVYNDPVKNRTISGLPPA